MYLSLTCTRLQSVTENGYTHIYGYSVDCKWNLSSGKLSIATLTFGEPVQLILHTHL